METKILTISMHNFLSFETFLNKLNFIDYLLSINLKHEPSNNLASGVRDDVSFLCLGEIETLLFDMNVYMKCLKNGHDFNC